MALGFQGKPAFASDDYKLLRLGGTWVKWGDPELGTRAKVTYALAGRMDSASARNCRAMGPVAPLLEHSGIAPETFHSELRAAFDAWSRAADITFAAVSDPEQADIVVGVQRSPRGKAYTDVAYDAGSHEAIRSIRKSLICLNPDVSWKVGFDGNDEIYDLRYTLAHEIGHAIGLDHPGPSGQIMSFQYSEEFRTPREGDIHGASLLYGERDAIATATPRSVSGREKQDESEGETASPAASSASLGIAEPPRSSR